MGFLCCLADGHDALPDLQGKEWGSQTAAHPSDPIPISVRTAHPHTRSPLPPHPPGGAGLLRPAVCGPQEGSASQAEECGERRGRLPTGIDDRRGASGGEPALLPPLQYPAALTPQPNLTSLPHPS